MDFQDGHGSDNRSPADANLAGGNVSPAASAGHTQVLLPDANNLVVLPEGATLDELSVQGRDLILTLPDGQVFVIPDGAVYVPQIVIGDVAVPPLNLAALLTGNEPQPAAGGVQSSGGNFADPTGPIQAAYGLGDLLPYTELSFPQPQQEEILPQPVNKVPDILIQDGGPASDSAVDTVSESGLSGDRLNGNQETPGSAFGSGSDVTTGTIFVTSEDGIASIAINGEVLTGEAGQQIEGAYGRLTLGALNGDRIAYTYELSDNTSGDNTSDVFTVVVTDPDGDAATATLTVNIVDDAPIARADTDSVPAADFTAQTGNVLSGVGTTSGTAGADTLGADGGTVTGVHAGTSGTFSGTGSVVTGEYGTLTLLADGSYSYARTPGTGGGVTDVFTYQVTDGDGDVSTATLTISIADSPPMIISVPEIGDGTQVNENQLPPSTDTRDGEDPGSQFVSGPESTTGTITFHSDDGLTSVSIGGTVVDPGSFPQVVSSDATGTLTVNDLTYDPVTGDGSVTYTYTLNDNTSNTDGTTVSFEITVIDADGDSATDNLGINIVDDVPTAHADTGSVTEGGSLTVPSLGVLTNDVPGADGATITGVATGTDTTSPVSGNLGGAGIAGTYGTLILNADGSYTYQSSANAVPPAGATDSFVYTITDGDGDTSTTTLTISLTDSGLAATNEDASVDEAALGIGSNPSSTAETVSGTLTDNASGGAGGYTYALVGSATGSHGTISIAPNGTWSYTLATPVDGATLDNGVTTENNVESFTYQVTDANGNTTTSTITIDVIDDVPTARADTDSVVEGASTDGNVLTGTGTTSGLVDVLGADGAAPGGAVTGVATGTDTTSPVSGNLGGAGIAGTYGTLILNADGSYTYQSSANAVPPAGATDSFVYTITDGDGDTSTATLTISLTDSGLAATNEDASVDEAALGIGSNPSSTAETVSGTLTDNASGGAGGYTYALVGSATGSHGTISIAPNGTWSYTLATPVDGATLDNGVTTENNVESFTYQVTDANGNTTTSTITIDVIDDVPTARADTDSVVEGASTDGNVLTGTGTTSGLVDVLGADGAAPGGAVTGVATGTDTTSPVSGNLGGAGIAGTYGTLILNADGSYTYQSSANAVPPAGATDSFVYTITDGDGDTSTTTLTISLTDSGLAATNEDASVDEAALGIGSNPSSTAETVSGTLTDNASGGAGGYTYALVGSATGSHGTISIAPNGTWSYTLATPVDGATLDNGVTTENNVESFTYQVTDANGNTTTSTITIDVIDDVPTARADTDSVVEGASTDGNVLTGTGTTSGLVDVLGADGAAPGGAVTGVATGTDTTSPVSGNLGGAGIAGTYGTLILNADGSYTYQSSANAVPPAGATDSFVYTITDGDGDTSTTTLTISLTDSGLAATNEDASVDEAALGIGSNPSSTAETVSGTLTDNASGGAGGYTYALVGSATGSHGTISIAPNGTWSYTLATPVDGATLDNGVTTENNVESFTYQVTDANGNTTTSTITIDVIDDVPTARADTDSVVEGASTDGNVLTGTGTTSGLVDVLGADGAAPGGAVTGVATGTDTTSPVSGNLGGAGIAGTYGTLILNADGSYTYQSSANAVPPAGATDSFVYTITDGDGDTSTTTLTISLTDSGLAATNEDASVDEAALGIGSNPSSTAETVSGTLTDNASGGAGGYTYALVGSATGSHGTISIAPNGTWSYTLATPVDGATLDNGVTTENNVESFTYQVTDANGNTTTSTITIDVIDDVPTARADTDSVVEGASTDGNVLTGTGTTSGLVDVLGADGAAPGGAVTGVATGTDTTSPVSGNLGGAGIAGTYGTLILNADGSYTYNSTANSISGNVTDSFVYTITDGDGDTSTTTLTISLTDVSLVGDDESVTVYEKALDTTQTGADVAAGSITGSMPSDTGETASGAVSVTGASGYSIAGGTVNGNLTTVVGTYGTLVLNNSTGAFTYTLTSPVTTTPSANDGVTTALGAESFTYTASDANGNTTTGTISIDVVDDTPYAVVPEAIQVTNGAAPVSAPADLDADMSVIDNYGADGAGTVRFAPSLDGADSGLTHNFVTITYTLVSDTVLEAYAGAEKIFTVTLDPSSATYTVDMDGTIDSIQNIDFNAGGYNFVGGNNSWSGFIPVGETVGAPIDNNSQDLLLTPSINHTNDGTINSTANTGGVSGSASVGDGETFRVDFVTDLRGNPKDGAGDYDTAANRDHTFDGHYTVNGAVALFKSTNGSTVNIAAFDDPDGNTVVGDGVKDAITGVSIVWRGAQYVDGSGNPIIIPTTTATNYTVNGHVFTVTLLGDGSVNVAGVEGDPGSSLVGTQIAIFTADGFNSVEYTWNAGSDFQIGDFGASTLTNDPVNFTIPVEVVDGDGDVSAQSNLSITAVTTTPPVALDLDGDGVEFLGLDAGVTHNYGSGLVQTAWVGADDGLLAHDTGHGLDIVFTDDAAGAETDLEGLRLAYDSNGDGKLTATDAAYGEFGVWQDANSNGVVDAGEFKTLAQMGITAIDLTAEGPGSLEANGDAIVHATGEYTMKGAAYALADVSFATASVDSQTTARTAEMAAITAAAAGFMMSGAAHAMPLSPIAIEAIAAAMQTFETHLPEVTVAVPENASATPPVSFLHDDRQVHQDSEPASHPAQHAAEQGAGHGLGEAVQHQDVATQPLGGGEQGHAQASPAPTLFGGGDSGLMQALLLAAQGKQAAGSDGQGNGQGNGHGGEHGPVDLPAVQEAIAESAGHHAVDSLIDHFAVHLGAHGAPAGGEAMGAEALDHALGTMLAGGGLEGLHAAGLAGGFEMAAMAAAMEAHSTTVA